MNNKSIYLIYETINCTPNGDPDNGEQRYNEISKRAVVSDLRIKRFGRDFLHNIGSEVFYYYDKETIITENKDKVTGSAARFRAFCEKNGIQLNEKRGKKVQKKNDETESSENPNNNAILAKEILLKYFLDVRIFGGILTHESFPVHITGALQFDAENESINEVIYGKNLMNRGITTVFPSALDKTTGSIGRDSYLRYGIFNIKGRFSASVAKENNATENDLNIMLSAIWLGMENINTRSKYGHTPITFIVIDHPTKETENGYLGLMLDKTFSPMIIKPNDGNLSNIYSRNDYEFDFTPLKNIARNENVCGITIYCTNDNFIAKHFSDIPSKYSILNPLDVLANFIK